MRDKEDKKRKREREKEKENPTSGGISRLVEGGSA